MGNFNSFTNCLLQGDSFGASRLFRKDFANRTYDRRSGTRPIHLASRLGLIDIIRLLIDNDCDIECETKFRERPIHIACMRGHLDVVQALLDANCDIECQTIIDRRPIHCACYSGNFDIVKLLIDKNCNIECEQTNGRRPIHCACNNGFTDIVKLLIENGCDIESETNNGERPIHFASRYGHTDIVRLLIDHNCVIAPQTEDMKTPLDLALSNGHLSCSQALEAALKQIDPLKKNERTRPTRRNNSVVPLAAPHPEKRSSTNKPGPLLQKKTFILNRLIPKLIPFPILKNFSIKNERRRPSTESSHSEKLIFQFYPILETFKQAMQSLMKLNQRSKIIRFYPIMDSSLVDQSVAGYDSLCRRDRITDKIKLPNLCLTAS